jgi:hypothetical protein
MDTTTAAPPRPWILPAALAIGLGAVAWLLGAWLTGRREPWDTDAYWTGVYPACLLGGLVLAWCFPDRAWRWPFLAFFGQFVGATLHAGEVGNLWPLALVWFGVLALPGVVLAPWVARRRRGA